MTLCPCGNAPLPGWHGFCSKACRDHARALRANAIRWGHGVVPAFTSAPAPHAPYRTDARPGVVLACRCGLCADCRARRRGFRPSAGAR